MMTTGSSRQEHPSSVQLARELDRLVRLLRHLTPRDDITLTTASTMRALDRYGPQRLSDLAVRERVTQPAMSQLVSRLERGGYARRRGDAADARVVIVELTPRGSQLLRTRDNARAAQLTELIAVLSSDDRAAIAAALPALRRLTTANLPIKPGDHS
jgi:DNA-binding MarR family transcriptional regulator